MGTRICLQPLGNNKFNVSLELFREGTNDKLQTIEEYLNLSFSDANDKIKTLRLKRKQKG